MTKAQWAVRYAKAGWSVFPGIRKSPHHKLLIATGYKKFDADRKEVSATYSEFFEKAPSVQQVEQWWQMDPEADIKLCCGRVSGVTVVDIDAKKDGDDPAESVLQKLGLDTMRSITGSGKGIHAFCRYAPMASGQVIPQVEVKNDRTTVTLPPSGHESGLSYEWAFTFPFGEENLKLLGPVPQVLADARPVRGKTPMSEWLARLNGSATGGRNEMAVRVAGKAMRALFDEFRGEPDAIPLLWDFMTAWNARNEPPMQERELYAVAKSVIGRQFRI